MAESDLTRLSTAINTSLKQMKLETDRKRSEVTLRTQNEELVKINKELDSFVYSVSHNLPAPLMSVLGLLNLAKMNNQDKDLTFGSYFSMMDKSIHKLDETRKEILDYSRNARNNLNIRETNIRQILDDSIERLKYMVGSDQIIRKIMIEEKSVLYSDPYRLPVIFNNLLSNATQYRDQQKEDAFVSFNITIDQQSAIIQCQDNGIGISDELLPKVFDIFFVQLN